MAPAAAVPIKPRPQVNNADTTEITVIATVTPIITLLTVSMVELVPDFCWISCIFLNSSRSLSILRP
ncbi:Uncharacterised protein [Chlamydia trachomatis]|nr:Uncharacterised protein [Chlamydia trachomatis]